MRLIRPLNEEYRPLVLACILVPESVARKEKNPDLFLALGVPKLAS